jgi:VanZ family protein
VAVYAGAIFAISSIPGRAMPPAPVLSLDKVVHFVIFLGLGAVVAWAWTRTWPAILACAAYGALDELHQRFTPGRSVEIGDFIADAAGAAVGALLILLIQRYRSKNDGADPQV